MSRFYTRDGTCIEGLREARKLTPLPLPSVSTVLSLLISPGLIHYFKRQMFEAAVTTPRQPGWTDDEFFRTCAHAADEHGKAARDKGTELHGIIQSYNLSRKYQRPVPQPPERWAGQYRSYVGWYEENVAESLAVEKVVFGNGYAGRVDHVCLLKDGPAAVVDVKTQNLTNRKNFQHYLSWALQLSAYGSAYLGEPVGDSVLISLCFDPNGSHFEAYEWPKPPHYYYKLFFGLCEIWREENNYWSPPNLGGWPPLPNLEPITTLLMAL